MMIQKTWNAAVYLLFSFMLLSGCEAPAKKDNFPQELARVFEAHGGYAKWQAIKSMSYTLSDGVQEWIAMPERKILVKAADRSIGYDGQQLWVAPDSASDAGARFRHSLFFYFFNMPFVLGDPGISYELVAPREIMGQTYHGIKISFEQGVGDAANDNYILWFDASTGQMHWLMYTSTFGTDQRKENYNLIHYAEWETIDGLKVPVTLQWHQFDQQTAGEVAGEAHRSSVVFSSLPADAALFAMPPNGRVVE